MTLLDLRTTVEDLLGTPIDEHGRLTAARVNRAINEGYQHFATQTRCFVDTATVEAADNTALYDLPADIYRPLRVWYDGAELDATEAPLLDKDFPGWRDQGASTPTTWMRWGANKIRLFPEVLEGTDIDITIEGEIVPSSEGATWSVSLLGEGDSPVLPVRFHKAPALYAVWYLATHLYSGDGDVMASGNMAMAEYSALVSEMTASMVNEEAYRGSVII